MSNIYLITDNKKEIYKSGIQEIFDKDEERYHKQLRPDESVDWILSQEINKKKDSDSDVSKICHRLCHDLIMYWQDRIEPNSHTDYLVYVTDKKTVLFGKKNNNETDYLALEHTNLNSGIYKEKTPEFKNLEREIKKVFG